jgi:ATP-dependent protease ClpP protease subunit
LIVDGALVLHGMVGEDWISDSCFRGRDVIDALAEIGHSKDVTVRLNSGGGDAFEGVAIYNALRAHGGKVHIMVEGVAASAASIIAQAGNPTVMCRGSTMMVHEPWGFAAGSEDDIARMATALGTIANAMVEIYAAKANRPPAQIRKEMKAETWMMADEAVAAGYADSAQKDDRSGEPNIAAFNYRLFAHAPERLVALTDTNGWVNIGRRPAAAKARALAAADLSQSEPGEMESQEGQAGGKSKAANPKERTSMTGENTSKAEADKAQAEAVSNARAVAAGIIAAATDAGAPKMAAALIAQGLTLEQAKAKIDGAVAIKAKVAQAHKMNSAIDLGLADAYIEAGASIDHVGSDLLDRLAKVSAVTAGRSTHSVAGGGRVPQPTTGPAPEDLNASGIYARRAKVRASRTPALVAYE